MVQQRQKRLPYFLLLVRKLNYEINSQYPTTDTATIQIPFPVPITKRIDSNDCNSLDLASVGRRFACSEIGSHFKFYVLLSENLYIKSGDFAVLQNEKIKIFEETDLVVETVERRHPDETLLILTLPCAYTYEIFGRYENLRRCYFAL